MNEKSSIDGPVVQVPDVEMNGDSAPSKESDLSDPSKESEKIEREKSKSNGGNESGKPISDSPRRSLIVINFSTTNTSIYKQLQVSESSNGCEDICLPAVPGNKLCGQYR